jgi:uncharacterized membrane protein YeaQ/YmgE (transglycosylase-associated protein family)
MEPSVSGPVYRGGYIHSASALVVRTPSAQIVTLEDTVTIQTILIWIVIGLIAGWLASAVVGGGYGVIGDIVVGIVGSFLGSFLFRALNIGAPFHGLASTIFVAFIGAIVLLLILRLIRRGSARMP